MLWVVKQDEKQHLNDMCAEQQKTENAFFVFSMCPFFLKKKRSEQENILIVCCSKSIEISPPPPNS